MPDGIIISEVASTAEADDVRRLFVEYASTLPIDLAYQDFAVELAALPGKYAPPSGVLLVARDREGVSAGCVAVRALESGACEMKRLYVRPGARGTGLGLALAAEAIAAASRLGYAEMRLDTLPSMSAALALYAALGFEVCSAYYAPTPPGTVFLSKTL